MRKGKQKEDERIEMVNPPFELIDHTGDVGLRVFGETKQRLFENAALGMFNILLGDVSRVRPRLRRNIAARGNGLDELLVNWLSELNFRFSAEGELCSRFRIQQFEDTCLRAQVQGELYDPGRHEIRVEIKAVTFHQIYVGPRTDGPGWEARVIFDI